MSGKAWAVRHLFPEPVATAGGGGPFDSLCLGPAHRVGALELTPICLSVSPASPGLLLSHDAIERGRLQVVEVGDGVAQQVEARNLGPDLILVVEGETLVGCKQNRVVARSVILGGHATVLVPVGCMEQGRWRHRGGTFQSGQMRVEPELRRRAAADLRGRRQERHASFDQSGLWFCVEERLAACHVTSGTSDYHVALETLLSESVDRARAVPVSPTQVGVIATLRGRLLGFELVGHPSVWQALAPRTLPSYIVGARSGARDEGAWRASRSLTAEGWFDHIRRAPLREQPALCLGVEVEMSVPGLVGAGLMLERRFEHLAVFEN